MNVIIISYKDGTYGVQINGVQNLSNKLIEQGLTKQGAENLKELLEYEYEHQNELIDKHYNKALSESNQEKLAAREFFSNFHFQKEVCNKILEELDKSL